MEFYYFIILLFNNYIMEEISYDKIIGFIYPVILDILERLIILSIIVILAHFVIQIIDRILGKVFDHTKFDQTLEEFIHKTIITVSWLITLGIVLVFLGVDVNAVVTSFGVGSFIIGFALKDTLNNLASGVMILLNKPFRVGDEVEIKGKRGVVRTISMSNTVLITKENEMITLPNSIVWGNPITNFTEYKG